MKRFYKSSIIIMVILLTIALPLTGCGSTGNVQDDIDEDLGGDLAGDIAGADVNPNNEWPDFMPESVPVFTDGTIVNNTGIRVGGQNNVTVSVEDVSQEAFDAYAAVIEGGTYELLTSSDSGGIAVKTFVDGENAISLQFAAKTGELTIGFTGN